MPTNTGCIKRVAVGIVFLAFLLSTTICPSFANTVQPSGSGGGGNSFGIANRSISVKDYGAKADGITLLDVSESAPLIVAATSATPTAPQITTKVNNAWVISVFGWDGNTFTPPVAPIARVSQSTVGSTYAVFEGDQPIAAPTTVAAQSGSITSTDYVAATAMLEPKGGVISSGTGSAFVSSCQVTAGQTCTLNVPSSTANGDLLLTCNSLFYTQVPAGTAVTSFNIAGQVQGATNKESLFCYTRTAKSEPASYTYNSNATFGQAAFLIDYKNANFVGQIFTSASATFTANDTGKLFSLGHGANGQVDGSFASFYDANDVGLSLMDAQNGTQLQAYYGTNDQTSVQNAINALPLGGTITTSGLSMMTTDLTFPGTGYFRLLGSGSGYTYNAGSASNFTSKPVSGFIWATRTGVTTAGIFISNGTTGANQRAIDIEDMVIIAGAGSGKDGGGTSADGIYSLLANGNTVRDVALLNWSKNCIEYPTGGGAPFTNNTFDHDWISYCGSYGIDGVFQGSTITGSLVQGSTNGIHVQGDLAVYGNTVQDNVTAEFVIGPGFHNDAGVVMGNYSEGGVPVFSFTSAAACYLLQDNWENNAAFPSVTFSNQAVALPPATQCPHYWPACVSDYNSATFPSPGATYTPVGVGTATPTTKAYYQSDGTVWRATGAGCF